MSRDQDYIEKLDRLRIVAISLSDNAWSETDFLSWYNDSLEVISELYGVDSAEVVDFKKFRMRTEALVGSISILRADAENLVRGNHGIEKSGGNPCRGVLEAAAERIGSMVDQLQYKSSE